MFYVAVNIDSEEFKADSEINYRFYGTKYDSFYETEKFNKRIRFLQHKFFNFPVSFKT